MFKEYSENILTGDISPPERDSSSAELLDVSVLSDPRDPRELVDGTGSDHFLDVFSLKEPVRSRWNPLPATSARVSRKEWSEINLSY